MAEDGLGIEVVIQDGGTTEKVAQNVDNLASRIENAIKAKDGLDKSLTTGAGIDTAEKSATAEAQRAAALEKSAKAAQALAQVQAAVGRTPIAPAIVAAAQTPSSIAPAAERAAANVVAFDPAVTGLQSLAAAQKEATVQAEALNKAIVPPSDVNAQIAAIVQHEKERLETLRQTAQAQQAASGAFAASAANENRVLDALNKRRALIGLGPVKDFATPEQLQANIDAARAALPAVGNGRGGGGGRPPVPPGGGSGFDDAARGANNASAAFERFRVTSSLLTGVIRSLALGLSGVLVGSITSVADQIRRTQKDLEVFYGSTTKAQQALANVRAITSQTSGSEASLATAASQLVRAPSGQAREFGGQNAALLSTLQKAGEAGLSDPKAIQASIAAITKDLQQGALTAGTFNQVLEQTPRIGKLIEDAFGQDQNALTAYLQAGQGSTASFFAGVTRQARQVEQEFAQTQRTIGSIGTQFGNSLQNAEGRLINSTTLSRQFGSAIEFLSTNIDATVKVVNSLAVGLGLLILRFNPITSLLVTGATLVYQYQDAINGFLQRLSGNSNVTIGNLFRGIGAGLVQIKDNAVAFFSDVESRLDRVFIGIGTFVGKSATAISSIVQTAASAVSGAFTTVLTGIENAFTKMLASIRQEIDTLVAKIPGLQSVVNTIGGTSKGIAAGTQAGNLIAQTQQARAAPDLTALAGADLRDRLSGSATGSASASPANDNLVQQVTRSNSVLDAILNAINDNGSKSVDAVTQSGSDVVNGIAVFRGSSDAIKQATQQIPPSLASLAANGSEDTSSTISAINRTTAAIGQLGQELSPRDELSAKQYDPNKAYTSSTLDPSQTLLNKLQGYVPDPESGGTPRAKSEVAAYADPAGYQQRLVSEVQSGSLTTADAIKKLQQAMVGNDQINAFRSALEAALNPASRSLSSAALSLNAATSNLTDNTISAYGTGNYYTRGAAPSATATTSQPNGSVSAKDKAANVITVNFTVNTANLDGSGFGASSSQVYSDLAFALQGALRSA